MNNDLSGLTQADPQEEIKALREAYELLHNEYVQLKIEMPRLKLKEFHETNASRAVEGFKTYKNVPITYWTTALAGEVGELCNMIKKMERVAHGGIDGGTSYTAASLSTEDLKEEIGGIAIYLDLLAGLLGVSLEAAIIDTFNSKSEKYGFSQKL